MNFIFKLFALSLLAFSELAHGQPEIVYILEIESTKPNTYQSESKPYSPLPPALEKGARAIEADIQRHQQSQNEFLPRFQQKLAADLESRRTANEIENNRIFAHLEKMGANRRPLRLAPPGWQTHAIYQISEESLPGVIESYLQTAASGNFDQARQFAEQLLYSNHTISALPGVNSDGIVDPTYFHPQTPIAPLGHVNFATDKSTHEGQKVRRLANAYQARWFDLHRQAEMQIPASHETKMLFGTGLAALVSADDAYASGDKINGGGLFKIASAILDFQQGFRTGFLGTIKEVSKAVPELGPALQRFAEKIQNDPSLLAKGCWNLILAMPSFGKQIAKSYIANGEKLAFGTAQERGEALGELAFDILALRMTGGVGKMIQYAARGAKQSAKNLSYGTKIKEAAATYKQFLMADKSRTAYSEIAREVFEPLAAQARKIANLPDRFPNITTGIKKAQTAAIVAENSSPVSTSSLLNLPRRLQETASKWNPFAKQGLAHAANNDPKSAVKILEAYNWATKNNHQATAQYIQRVTASKTQIGRDFLKVVETHARAMSVMKDLPRVSRSGVFSRGILKEARVDGKLVRFAEKNVFDRHVGQRFNEHRYTIGGELGRPGLYLVEGPLSKTKGAILEELGTKKFESVVIAEKNFDLHHLLDLTDDRVLKKLGIVKSELRRNDYSVPQAVGDAATQSGFKGLLIDSTKEIGVKNVVIFD